MTRTIITLLLLAILLGACAPAIPTTLDESIHPHITQVDRIDSLVYRFVDAHWNVVCYVHRFNGGISCIPLSQTGVDF